MDIRLWVAPAYSKRAEVRLIRALRGDSVADAQFLFSQKGAGYSYGAHIVENMEEADFVVAAQPIYPGDRRGESHVIAIAAEARLQGKTTIAFAGGDLSAKVHIPGVHLLKASSYAHSRKSNEIISVPAIEDLPVAPIRRRGKKPIVGFCGYAGFPDLPTRLKFYVKNASLDVLASISGKKHLLAYKRGIFFRRASMRSLARDERIETKFVLRDTFSGNRSTIALDPAAAREEGLSIMRASDFVLAPKGDGNYSTRFFEALALGRIPLLIDTDMELPLEGIVPYQRFILRIPHTQLELLPQLILEFWEHLSDSEYEHMQRNARAAYEQYLRHDAFYRYLLPALKDAPVA